jgi:FtsP/CotA-like multicopper oxidase with cupredoxin domain
VRLGLAGNLSQLMASYNGSLPAPTLRLSPGDKLIVHLTNGLASGATNLHMHGLHVSPNEDDTFAQVAPGMSRTYLYTLPSDHHAGTFWYHPHYHPTQTVQAGAGAFGMVIVDPPAGSLPAELASMSETILVLHHLTDSTCAAAGGNSLYDCASRNVPGAMGAMVLVNGRHAPRIASDGGWSRWRLLFNAVNAVLEPQVPVGCEAHLLAKDGLYLQPATPRRVSAAYLAPGSRADWLVACTAGVHELSATLTWESGATETVLLAHVDASASASSRTGSASSRRLFGSSASLLTLPFQPFAPPRPCYLADLQRSNPTRSLPVSLEGYSINGRSYHSMVGAFESVLDLGEVYQLEVTGAHETHPLHLHTNAFQIVSLPAAVAAHRSGHFAVGDWHDTLVTPTIPTTGRSTDRILVRFVTDRFGGRVPLHCHGLNHADMGMMSVYYVRGAEGTSVPGCAVKGAAALDTAWVAPSANAADGVQGVLGAPISAHIGATSLTLTSVFVGGVLVVWLALCLWRCRSQRALKLAVAGSSSGSAGTGSRRFNQDWHAAQGKSSDDEFPDDESCASTDSLLIPTASYMFLRSIYVSAFNVPPIR